MIRLYQLSKGDMFYASKDTQYAAPKNVKLQKLGKKGGLCRVVDTGEEVDLPTMMFVELAKNGPQEFSVKLGEEVEELLNEKFDDDQEEELE